MERVKTDRKLNCGLMGRQTLCYKGHDENCPHFAFCFNPYDLSGRHGNRLHQSITGICAGDRLFEWDFGQALPVSNAVGGGEYRSKEGNKLTIRKDKGFRLNLKREYKITGNGRKTKKSSKFLSVRFGQDFQGYGGAVAE